MYSVSAVVFLSVYKLKYFPPARCAQALVVLKTRNNRNTSVENCLQLPMKTQKKLLLEWYPVSLHLEVLQMEI